MKTNDDTKRIAEEVVNHLLFSQLDMDEGDSANEADEAFMREAAKLLWDAVNNPDMSRAKSFTVKRDDDGNVVLVVNR